MKGYLFNILFLIFLFHCHVSVGQEILPLEDQNDALLGPIMMVDGDYYAKNGHYINPRLLKKTLKSNPESNLYLKKANRMRAFGLLFQLFLSPDLAWIFFDKQAQLMDMAVKQYNKSIPIEKNTLEKQHPNLLRVE